MSLLVRPPGDHFTFRLFINLTNRISEQKDLLYLWSTVLLPTYTEFQHHANTPDDWDGYWVHDHEFKYRSLIEENIKNDIVVIGVKDHLTPLHFNPWISEQPTIAWYLNGLFEYYSEKKFILFTSVENAEAYINAPNVKIVPWGGDITNHQSAYMSLEPLLNKNLDSKHTFVSLNRNQRNHRCMLLALLHGLNIQEHGIITCLFKDKFTELFESANWQFSDQQQPVKELLANGFDTFKSNDTTLSESWEIYKNGNNDNVSNFKNKLAAFYKETFVEIVTETSYTEACFNVTEKTLNSVYGCNFPIFLCSKGTVKFLRDMGLDVFDDVVNHSYDEIENPIDRLYAAIHDNIELLSNNERTKQLWQQHKERFINNVDFVKHKLYNFYSSRAETLFLEAKNEFNV